MNSNGRLYAGVDVGGTKILAIGADEQGALLCRVKARTLHDGTLLAEQVAGALDALLRCPEANGRELGGIGLAVPGTVDSQTGAIVHVPNLAVDDLRLVDHIAERYQVAAVIGNDVNLGTLAEAQHGAGRGEATVVGVFVGTGIGGGVVTDGILRTGPEDLAGEIGHMVMQVDGALCGCGNRGCFETLASRTAIERAIREGLEQGKASRIMEFAREGRITSGVLREALDAGDDLVVEVLSRAGHYLGQGALTIRHLLDPDVIIFGGGVIEALDDFLMPLIHAELAGEHIRGSRDTLKVVVSELGDDAVALGAAALLRGSPSSPSAVSRAAPETVLMPTVDSVSFGRAVVGGENRAGDLHIRADGKVRKRPKRRAREAYGTSHLVGPEELRRLCKGGPATVIIGCGFHEMLRLHDDGRAYLERLGIRWQSAPTPEAVRAYNEMSGPRALLLHVTC